MMLGEEITILWRSSRKKKLISNPSRKAIIEKFAIISI
jgi:hypothetical protein